MTAHPSDPSRAGRRQPPLGRSAAEYAHAYAAGRADAEGGLHGPPTGGGGGGGRSGCRGRLWLVLLLWPLLVVLTLCRHRSGPQPGDPGWTHPDVLGSTDPEEIARIIRDAEAREVAEQERIRAEQAERHRLAAEQQRRSR